MAEPHSIRLRNWTPLPHAAGLERPFHRPTGLDACDVFFVLEPTGSIPEPPRQVQVSLNDAACESSPPPSQTSDLPIYWQLPVDDLQPRNVLRVEWDASLGPLHETDWNFRLEIYER